MKYLLLAMLLIGATIGIGFVNFHYVDPLSLALFAMCAIAFCMLIFAIFGFPWKAFNNVRKAAQVTQRWNGRYLVCPGTVISKSDGDSHFINASQLIRLYDVDPRRCNIDSGNPRYVTERNQFIVLTPRPNGDYDLLDAARRSGFLFPPYLMEEKTSAHGI